MASLFYSITTFPLSKTAVIAAKKIVLAAQTQVNGAKT